MHDSVNDCKLQSSNNIKDARRMKNDLRNEKKVKVASVLLVVVLVRSYKEKYNRS